MHQQKIINAFLQFLTVLPFTSGTSIPNAFPKQLAAVRRRSGLTHVEFLNYNTLVHGQKAWNSPINDTSRPIAYYHNHIFDSVFGANDSVPDASWVGRDGLIELYSGTEEAFLGEPSTNYTQTVIGPDGEWFSDEATAFSMFAYESQFCSGLPTCNMTEDDIARPITAFYWVAASNSSGSSFDNGTFAQDVASAFAGNLTGAAYNISYHTQVPGTDSTLYYGGSTMPAINAVVKFWLCDTGAALSTLRAAQTSLPASLGIDVDTSFMVFSRSVAIYDDTEDIPFDIPRLEAFIAAETHY